MKPFKKNQEFKVIKGNNINPDEFVVQFNRSAPHIRLYQRKKRGDIVIHKKVNEFYNMRKAVACSWVLSQREKNEG